MTYARKALTLLLIASPLLGAASFFGTSYYRYYQITDKGIVYGGTASSQNNNGDTYTSRLCRASCASVPCSLCHVGEQDRSKETYTVANHERTYFPQFTVAAKEGYRTSFGSYGGSLIFKNNQYAYVMKDGHVNAVAPAGTRLFRDLKGVPFVLWMPSDPKILK